MLLLHPSVPTTIKGYEIREVIGKGGFGNVYRAYQPTVKREVAIKVIQPEFANHPDFIRRFETEAQLIAQLEHPHIVPLYDFWRDPGGAYLVMRYLKQSLRSAMEKEGWSLPAVARLVEQLGAALMLAHQAGVIHRDIKPDNILLDEHHNAYIADFGIARVLSALHQTNPGVFRGSPGYATPEQITSGTVTPRTDIYSLGLVVFELLAGRPAFTYTDLSELLHKQLNEPIPWVSALRPGLPTALDDVLQKATAKDADARYPDMLAFMRDFCRAAASAAPDLALSATNGKTITPGREILTPAPQNPYKGLRAFHEADQLDFYGRETLVAHLVNRLAEPHPLARFLALVGPSGSGKSSAVRAGLMPQLKNGALPGSEKWFYLEMLPGTYPLDELEIALLRIATNNPTGLAEHLRRDERGLVRAARLILPNDSSELVLFIDQFEEVFTLAAPDQAQHLLDLLVLAASEPRSRVRIILAIRADFYDRPLLRPSLSELLRQRTEIITPLTPAELEQAIVAPALRQGIIVERALVTEIVAESNEQPGTLPLLQYALTELFDRRDPHTRRITLASYQHIGGLLGALTRKADEVYTGLPEPLQAIARQLCLRLVTLGAGTEDTRRRVLLAELLALTPPDYRPDSGAQPASHDTANLSPVAAVLAAFEQARLLTFDRDPVTRAPTVEVAHEAILRRWMRLRSWLEDARADIQLQRLLAAAAAEWLKNGQDSSFLLQGARLAQFEGWAQETSLALTTDEHGLLTASIAERHQQEAREAHRQAQELRLQHQAAHRLRYLVAVLVLAVIGVLGLSAIIFREKQQADAARTASEHSAQIANENYRHADALRLASAANVLLPGQSSNAELATLLAIRSLNIEYTAEADAALQQATTMLHTRQVMPVENRPRATAFAPDGSQYIIGDSLYDTASGALIRRFSGHEAPITSVAFSPDGRFLMTGSLDGTARLWDAASGELLHQFEYQDRVTEVGFTPDGSQVFIVSFELKVEVRNLSDGALVEQFESSGFSAAVSPDGRYLFTDASPDGVLFDAAMWDRETGAAVRYFVGHTAWLQAVRISADGRWLLTTSQDSTVRLWEVATGAEIRRFLGHQQSVSDAVFVPGDEYILTTSVDGTARLWRIATGEEVRRFTGHRGGVYRPAIAPAGTQLLTVSSDQTARLWDLRLDSAPHEYLGLSSQIDAVTFSPDARFVAAVDSEQARVWDAASGEPVWTITGQVPFDIEYSRDGALVLVGNQQGPLTVHNAADGRFIRAFGDHAAEGAFSPDGMGIVTGEQEGLIQVWNLMTGAEIQRLVGHEGAITDLDFSPDGRYLASVAADATLRLWDMATGQQRWQATIAGVYASSVAFSPDGRYLATGDYSSQAIVWDAQTGAEIRRMAAGASLLDVQFSPDGQRLAAASFDGSVWLWQSATGQLYRRLRTRSGQLGLAFAPDGRSLLSGAQDATVRLWQVEIDDAIADACSRLQSDFTEAERERYQVNDMQPTCP